MHTELRRPMQISHEHPWLPACCSSQLDFLLRELDFQSERIGEAVGQVHQADQQVDIDNLLIGEVLLQGVNVGVGDGFSSPRKFFGVT